MLKLILMMLLAVVSNSAMAEWKHVGVTTEFTEWVDLSTVRRTGSKVKVWTMQDYFSPKKLDGETYLSTTNQVLFNCKEEQVKSLYVIFSSENFGEGKQVRSYANSGNWEPIPPGDINEAEWKIVCNKK